MTKGENQFSCIYLVGLPHRHHSLYWVNSSEWGSYYVNGSVNLFTLRWTGARLRTSKHGARFFNEIIMQGITEDRDISGLVIFPDCDTGSLNGLLISLINYDLIVQELKSWWVPGSIFMLVTFLQRQVIAINLLLPIYIGQASDLGNSIRGRLTRYFIGGLSLMLHYYVLY